jgi:hypothetical protein
MIKGFRRHREEEPMLIPAEPLPKHVVNESARLIKPHRLARKQRVTITLPVALLERLRNAVYWTGHGPLARIITDALEDAVTQIEQANGGTFPERWLL